MRMPKPTEMSVDEYLETEPTSEFKREFFHGEVFAMTGAFTFWLHSNQDKAKLLIFSIFQFLTA